MQEIKGCMFCTWCEKTLLSIGQLVEKDVNVVFNKFGCTIKKSNTGEVVIVGRKVGRMFVLNDEKNKCLMANEKNEFELWHKRLGHVSANKLLDISKND